MMNFPKRQKVERLSVSIPANLVQWVRETATKYETSMSAVVAESIRRVMAQELSNAMVEGLLEDSFEDVPQKITTGG